MRTLLRCVWIVLVVAAGVVVPRPAAGQAFTPIRINAGGPAFTDSVGQVWAADQNFSGGTTYTTGSAIAGTVEDTLYKSERWGTFAYNVPVPNGTYTVTLKFAEIAFASANARLFSVAIEGQPVLSNFDIYATAGANTAVDRTFAATVVDGTLNIAFTASVDDGKLSALQVVSAAGTPLLTQVSPTSGFRGSTNMAVTLTGTGTHFTNASAVTFSGTGVTAGAPTAVTATSVTVPVTITTGATLSARTVTVTTGGEVVSLASAFTVLAPTLTQVAPPSGPRGATNLAVTVTGNGSHFTNASAVTFSGTGVTAGVPTAVTATSVTVPVTITAGATLSARTVTVTTGAQVVSLASGFTVTAGTPVLTQVSPVSGPQGAASLAVTLTGSSTSFSTASVVTFSGTGVTAGTPTAATATSLTVPVTITAGAALGARTVTVTTGAQVVSLASAFTVTAGTPALTQVSPTSGVQGASSLAVTLTGSFTTFTNASVVTFSGTGVTAGTPTAATATSLTVPVTITAGATLGARTVTVTTGAQVVSLASGFTVTAVAPAFALRINSGGASFVDGAGQTWVADQNFTGGAPDTTTVAVAGTTDDGLFHTERYGNFAYNIPVSAGTYAVTLRFAELYWTTAGQRVFSVAIEGQSVLANFDIVAAGGANTAVDRTFQVSVTDGTLNIAFTTLVDNAEVTAVQVVSASGGGTPTLTQVNPASGPQGATNLAVTLTGNLTNFTNASVVTFSGTGVTAAAPTTATATSLTVPVTIAPGATLGARTVTVTTGAQVVSAASAFTVTAGVTPVLTQVNPTGGPQGATNLAVTLTGSLTNFTNASVVTFSGTGVTAGTPTTATATSVTVPVTITAGATVGARTVTVTTGAQIVSAANAFTITAVTPGTSTVRINAGGPAFTDSIGQLWSADQNFTGGSTFSSVVPIAGTVEDTLFQTERFGNFSYALPVASGTYHVKLHFAELYWTGSNQRVFNVQAEGAPIINALDIFANIGANTAMFVETDVTVLDGVLNLDFVSTIDNAKLSAIEVSTDAHVGDPFLHVVIAAPQYVVDSDGNGSEVVALQGQTSHTHEPGKNLVSFVWTEGTTVLGTSTNLTVPLSVGTHVLTLTITDDNVPGHSLADSVTVPVYPLNAVGGVLAQYYPAGATPITTLIDALPSQPGFIEVLPTLRLDAVLGKIGGSSYASNVVASLKADYEVTTPGTYQFTLSGGTATRFFLNGGLVGAPVALSPGTYTVEARFALANATSLPAQVMVSINGGAATAIPGTALHHDESLSKPFINSMPSSGSGLGGESVTIAGFGFFPSAGVTVNWGGGALSPSAVFVTPTALTVTTPPGSGAKVVTVQTPNGTSNAMTFTYNSSVIPISFATPETIATPDGPTQAAWGPDGRLYVASVSGQITAYTFDDNYLVIGTQIIQGVSGLSNSGVLGIAFNPLDPPSPVRVYVSHGALFANGGACFSGVSAYSGQISRLDGPNFTTITPLITKLPVSNHDHSVNGLVFDNNGDLFIAQGGNTNAGVAGNCNIGQIPESPLSAAVLKAQITKPGFNGAISYKVTATGVTNNDQNAGETVDVAPGVDVKVFTPGLRNPFDLTFTTSGHLFAIDNGPNISFGEASTSATTQSPDPSAPDEVLRLVQGSYYGHPNRNRGRYDSREYVYRGPSVAAMLGQHTPPLATVGSSSDGVDEYRATTFNSGMRGSLLVAQLNGLLYRVALNGTSTAVTSVQTMGSPLGLDVVTGPGGAILSTDYYASQLKVLRPSAVGAPSVAAYDIFPWRGRADGATPFVIGGVGFGSMGSTTVTIGGVNAVLTYVSPTRIRGLVPAKASPTSDLLDVVVQTGGQVSTITKAFRYVFPAASGKGLWTVGPPAPTALNEASGGAINGVLLMVGQGAAGTFAFDIGTETWQTLATRPFVGTHHAAEVINGKLYLFGGLGGSSEGKVQIFNPVTNAWTTGAAAPFAAGSASTAVINGLVYMAGGIIGGNTSTTNQAAVYNPTTNTWSAIANMPAGRNYAAAGTDGTRFFVFGGRGPGSGDTNIVALGFDDVQIYDPGTNTWECSCTLGSTVPPLPQKRGGMGKAALFGGEFYVIGGETTAAGTGQVAGNVYNRVDVYNPATKTWRVETALPTARHGVFTLDYDGRIFVIGGGTQAGTSNSQALEIFSR